MNVFLDVSPVYWPVPSGISVQIHELARQRHWCTLPVTLVNFSRYRSRLNPSLDGVRWLPGLHRIERRAKINLARALLHSKRGTFLATGHYLPNIRADIWHFVYDLIRVIFPDFYSTDGAEERTKLRKRVERSTRVVVPSRNTARDLQRVLGNEVAYTVLPAAVDVAWFGQKQDSSDGSPIRDRHYIYTNGVVQPRKRFDWSFALASHLDLPLVATGAMTQTGALALAAISKRYPAVRFRHLGLVSRDVQRRLYQDCSIFSFPSQYEGFGMPVLEAMAAGAIVVAANTSSIPEVLDDAEQMFETESLESFLERGRALLMMSQEVRASMSARNQTRAYQFGIEAVAKRFWMELEAGCG